MIERLNVPNGYNCRVDPYTGRWISMGNATCAVAELSVQGDQVQVVPGSHRTLENPPGQSYAGFWWKPDELLRWYDVPGQRYRQRLHMLTGDTRTREANGTYFHARDGWFVEWQAGAFWLSSGPVSGAYVSTMAPPTLGEQGWLLFPTDNMNTQLRMITPDWRTHYFRPAPAGGSLLHIEGPGVATCGLTPTLVGWAPPVVGDVAISVAPPSSQYPWGEVPDYIWTRKDGRVWLASHVLEPEAVGGPQSWVILRPFAEPLWATWFAVPPLTYLTLADLGDRVRLVGSSLADAWATDVVI